MSSNSEYKGISVLFLLIFAGLIPPEVSALVFTDTALKVYQFPIDKIPRIDGDISDWEIVPENYKYGTDMLLDVENERNIKVDPADCDVTVRVGWVNGLNRLYFLYEAYDNYWDFENPGLHNDMFEITVDTDLSGGDFIYKDFNAPDLNGLTNLQENSHAQNFHICTPAVDKSWAMVWNCPAWLNKFPYMNCAYSYDFKHGESGRLIMECWITPYDLASFDGPESSTVCQLEENSLIGLSWLIADWDGPGKRHALPSLSHNVMQVHDASYLRPFRLMPLEDRFVDTLDACYTFDILDNARRVVSFKDTSRGSITSWLWDFGDGTVSNEQNPVHTYEKPGYLGAFTVMLTIKGPKGTSSYTTLMEVIFRNH
ncbi:MAG: PKD domain-containing protein [Candidatus Latescibacteria bacterium]|nr:PKD domain-containing protein [Candidatus Latescibacterota bacterium]